MIRNNIALFREKLEFDVDGVIYTIMILRRAKDGLPDATIKKYHISNLKEYDEICKKIPELCEEHKARAYISVNRKLITDIGLDMIKNLAIYIKNKNYDCIRLAFDKTFGSTSPYGENKWVVDIDTDDVDIQEKIAEFTETYTNVYYRNYTKSGMHLITRGFNPKDFSKQLESKYPETKDTYEIKNSQPNTILYV